MKNFNPMQFNGFQNNPMQMFMQNMPGIMPNNFQINKNQFKQFLPNMNDNIFEQLKQQARAKGISEEEIEQGMNFIKGLVNK